MDGVSSTHGEIKNAFNSLVGKFEGKKPVVRCIGLDGRIVLKRILGKWC
jgi:hypothetical protein